VWEGAKAEEARQELFSGKMAVDLYVFSTFVEHGVLGNRNSGLIVAMQSNRLERVYSQFSK